MPNAVAQSIRAQNVIRKVWERVEWSAKLESAKFGAQSVGCKVFRRKVWVGAN